MKKRQPIAVDLFAGAGGVSEGMIQAGFHIIYSNELSQDAALTYDLRHKQLGLINGVNTILEVDDIKNISGYKIIERIKKLPSYSDNQIDIDLVFGGPPCQGFSRAGKQSHTDIRNRLFTEYLRVISELKPKYIIFENVLGITDIKFNHYDSIFDKKSYKNSHALDIIKNELEKIEYKTLNYSTLNAADFGVPQNRKRVFLIAYRNNMKIPSYPIPTHLDNTVSVMEALGDISGFKNETEYQKQSRLGRTPNINRSVSKNIEILSNNEKTQHKKYIEERFSLLQEGESTANLRKRIISSGIDLNKYPNLLEFYMKKTLYSKSKAIQIFKEKLFDNEDLNILLTKKNSRRKLLRSIPSSTVLTLPDDIISPFENRIFTVRELARLQSFDDSFVFYGKRTTGSTLRRIETPQYTQVGNAVPPLLARAIAKEIIEVLEN